MKRFISIIIALFVMLGCCAYAESTIAPLDDALFDDAKEALVLFEAGDYEAASALLGFATADELMKFVTGNYSTFGNSPVQTKVSVAWWTGSAWLVAVPLCEPASPEVEVLVLMTNDIDCSAFCGYRYATWGDIEEALAACDYVIWNEEYIESKSMIIYTDD